jgi:TolB protein
MNREVTRVLGLVATIVAACGCGSGTDETRILPWAPEVTVLAAEPSLAAQMPIIFRSDRDQQGVGDLYAMAADGSSVRRLTEGGDFWVPTWSPDGETIAFRQSAALDMSVGLISADGGPPVLLTDSADPADDDMPVHWSPDGERLAYASARDATSVKMWEMSPTGGQRRRLLPDNEMLQEAASWAGDGRLLYTLERNILDVGLWMMEPQGNEPIELTQGRVYMPHYCRWSPDGTQIVLEGYPVDANGNIEGFDDGTHSTPPDSEIYVMDVRSGELQRLTDNSSDEYMPAWSPDGKALIFSSEADGDLDLWLLPLDGVSQARNLIDDADLPRDDHMPDWFWGP